MTKTMLGLLGVVVLIANAGCAAETESHVDVASSALTQGLPGTYEFVVDASDVAAKLRAKCDSESRGDKAHAEKCFDAIRAEAKLEKIRFTRTGAGDLVYTSFAVDGDREEIFVEVPVAITRVEHRAFVAKSAGLPRGTLVGRLTHLRAEIRVEHPDDTTIVMIDPSKGRLVYRRAG